MVDNQYIMIVYYQSCELSHLFCLRQQVPQGLKETPTEDITLTGRKALWWWILVLLSLTRGLF